MDDAIGQLLTLGVIFGAWIVKGVMEAKKKRERAAQRPHSPHPEHPQPRHPQAPDLREQEVPVPPPMPERRTHTLPHLGPRHPGTLQRSRLVSQSDSHATVVRSARTRERRARVLRVLAPRIRAGDARALTRAGVLWSEVLGPPRAYRGPHRPPSTDRPY